jgi:GntR family transcriptional regulator / MocR family aminotransferase
MMPMASLDRNGNVIYIGTLSKSLAPAIRVGFMVAPERFIRSATSLRKAIDTQGTTCPLLFPEPIKMGLS